MREKKELSTKNIGRNFFRN